MKPGEKYDVATGFQAFTFDLPETDSTASDSQFPDSEQVSTFNQNGHEVPSPEDLSNRMGQAFVNAGKLTQEDVTRIVQLQRRRRIRFGEAAIKLGLLTEDDVHEVLAQQFKYQTIVRHGSGSKKRISEQLLIAHSPYSTEAEVIRRFRSEILLRAGDSPCLILALVSPNPKEGKSHLCASLAIAFAQLNFKTLLIDANLRRPSQHQFFDLSNKTGLSTMLAGRTLPTLDLSHSITNNLNIITAGPKPPNPSEILSAPSFSDLIERFKSDVRVIIVDTPPTRVGADAQIIAPQVGNVVIVCRKDTTHLSELRHTYEDMLATQSRILGSFYNTVPESIEFSAGWAGKIFGRFKSLRAKGP